MKSGEVRLGPTTTNIAMDLHKQFDSLPSPPLTMYYAGVIIHQGEIFLIVGSLVSGADITGGTFTSDSSQIQSYKTGAGLENSQLGRH